MKEVAAHHLLGRIEDASLVLLAGPDYLRILGLARLSGIPVVEAVSVPNLEDVEDLKTRIAQTGESQLVIASMHEIEGRLDRSSFERRLIDLAYSADRVVYAGLNGAAIIHPVAPGTRMQVIGGNLRVTQHLDLVEAGASATGLTVDRL